MWIKALIAYQCNHAHVQRIPNRQKTFNDLFSWLLAIEYASRNSCWTYCAPAQALELILNSMARPWIFYGIFEAAQIEIGVGIAIDYTKIIDLLL